MADYDVGSAIGAIEKEIISSMMRNMKKHRVDEANEGKQWDQWQAKQLESLERFKKKNKKKYDFNSINKEIEELIEQSYTQGGMESEIEILNNIKKRYGDNVPNKFKKFVKRVTGKDKIDVKNDFFSGNDKKVEKLIEATTHDLSKAEHAMLRRANDQYRKTIFNAQMYAMSGAGSYEKAVDMATKDFLAAGINCVEYKNGRRVSCKAYAEMCIRTANKRATIMADGNVRRELGIHTVIVGSNASACPMCAKWLGKILIDDVYSGGTQDDGDYPLLSEAIKQGFLHPNCRDTISTYFDDGFNEEYEKELSAKQNKKEMVEEYNKEQRNNYAKNQAEKYSRLEEHSLDADNKKMYGARKEAWEKKQVKEDVSQAKAKNKKIEITQTAIEKVKKLSLDGYSNEQCELLQQKHKELLKIAMKNDSNEVLNMFNAQFEKDIITLGDETSVKVSQNRDARTFMMKAKENSVIWIHNHPKCSSFSYEDIGSFLQQPQIKTMTIVTNQGKVYALNKKKDFDLVGIYDKIKEMRKLNINQDDIAKNILREIGKYGVEYIK